MKNKKVGMVILVIGMLINSAIGMDLKQLVPVAHFSTNPTYHQKSYSTSIEVTPYYHSKQVNYKELDYAFQSTNLLTKSLVEDQTNAIITVLQSLCGDHANPVNVLSAQMNLIHLSHSCGYINEPFNIVRERILDLLFDASGSLKSQISSETSVHITLLNHYLTDGKIYYMYGYLESQFL